MITPLQPIERGYLYAFGILRFPPAKQIPKPVGRTPGRKNSTIYGKVKIRAAQFLESGEGASLAEFASRNRLNYESFKGAVWKLRKEREVAA